MATPQVGLDGVDRVRVSEIMVTPVRTVAPDASVGDLIRLLLSEQITGAPVVDGANRLLGVVSFSDVLRAILSDEEVAAGDTLRDPDAQVREGSVDDPQETLLGYFRAPGEGAGLPALAERTGAALSELTVADIMTPAAFGIAPDATVRELASFLTRGRIHRSLVVDQGALRGIVTSSDVVRLVAGESKEEDT